MLRGQEEMIGQLRLRCKHGSEQGDRRGEGGAAPQAKRPKPEPAASMRAGDLRLELWRRKLDTNGTRRELAARLEEHRRSDAVVEGKKTCSWRGRVSELARPCRELRL